MSTDNAADADFRRNLILASALLHTQTPPDRIRANCFRVLRHALTAAGLWEERHSEAFHGETEDFPSVGLWYSTLIEMALEEPASQRLLEGAGRFETFAGAYYTACWLTPAGRRVAERLLTEHPEWKARLTGQGL